MSGGEHAASQRIARRFAELKVAKRAGLVPFVTAGDPDQVTSLEILRGLPAAGADLIELGMPFSDPMADGPAVQAASLRALGNGASMKKTLGLVRAFRVGDAATPVVLMGYYNPVYRYGVDRFISDALEAGVDGLIMVDLPPEEDQELCLPAIKAGLTFVRLATPTTDDQRLLKVLKNGSGFIYYVSIAGITGTAAPDVAKVTSAVARIRRVSDLPIAVGFGIRNAEQAAAVAVTADAVAVGSALVSEVAAAVRPEEAPARVLGLVKQLAEGVRNARKVTAE